MFRGIAICVITGMRAARISCLDGSALARCVHMLALNDVGHGANATGPLTVLARWDYGSVNPHEL